MAEIRSMEVISEKWSRVTPQRRPDYEYGIKNPRRDWAESAAAANDSWKGGVAAAAAGDRFAKGVKKVGTAKWKDRSIKKGPSRFAEGVIIGRGDYQKAFAPFADAIKAVTLPERFPKGDPRNIERVAVIATALHNKRLEQLG